MGEVSSVAVTANRIRKYGRSLEELPKHRPITLSVKPKSLVSVLIPAFNAEEWISDTLRSAIAQTWESKEIIVIDDGSTDRTFDIARQFESDSVHVVRQSNQGAAGARNRALSLSHGEYIQWLDADDLLAPDKIARQVEALAGCPSKRMIASCGWGRFMYRPHKAKFVSTALWCDLSPVDWLVRKMGQNLYMQTATWLVSRELTERAGPWDVRLLGDDDNEYFCRVLLASDGIRFVPAAKTYYRSFGYGSLGYVGRSDRKLEAHWLSMQLHIRHLRSAEDTKRVRIACVRYLQDWLYYFYPERPDIAAEAEQLARELGGDLHAPRLSWKYAWVRALFGWPYVRPFQVRARKIRWSLQRAADKALSRFEDRNSVWPLPDSHRQSPVLHDHTEQPQEQTALR
jgi:glycosyltransferase involved in cell wall biosynthesis